MRSVVRTPEVVDALQRFARNCQDRRRELDLTQGEIAFRSGLSNMAVSRVETAGGFCRIPTFIRLVGGLETTPSALIEGILWTPRYELMAAGRYEVPEDPLLAAEVAQYRKIARRIAEEREREITRRMAEAAAKEKR